MAQPIQCAECSRIKKDTDTHWFMAWPAYAGLIAFGAWKEEMKDMNIVTPLCGHACSARHHRRWMRWIHERKPQ